MARVNGPPCLTATSQVPEHQPLEEAARESRPKASVKEIKPNFSPSFWDSLPIVILSRRSLRELDRRTAPGLSQRRPQAEILRSDVRGFARHGGPDTRHLCNYPSSKNPSTDPPHAAAGNMPEQRKTRTARPSSAYDPNFENHLIQHGIFPMGYEHERPLPAHIPKNLDSLHREVMKPRRSTSPSRPNSAEFQAFQREVVRVASEDCITGKLLPTMTGPHSRHISNSRNVQFRNLDTMTNEVTVAPAPDFYDGARHGQLSRAIREELDQFVIPSNNPRNPVAPNFFLELKGPKGHLDVGLRQACHDGASGARAMHHLKNYGLDKPQYDGNAHAFSATYYSGFLDLYAHHVSEPAAEGEEPQYHMTTLASFSLKMSDTYVQGLTALRNTRDLAERFRNELIDSANARARGTTALESIDEELDEESLDGEDPAPAPKQSDQASNRSGASGASPCVVMKEGENNSNNNNGKCGSQEAGSFLGHVPSSPAPLSQLKRKRNPRLIDDSTRPAKMRIGPRTRAATKAAADLEPKS